MPPSIFTPGRKLGPRHLLLCQIFPACYLAYVLIRGSMVGWYPYPFLNPVNVGGYRGVTAYAVALAVSLLLAAWSLLALGNKLGRKAVVTSN